MRKKFLLKPQSLIIKAGLSNGQTGVVGSEPPLRLPSGTSGCLRAIHLGLIPSRAKSMTLKLIFTAFLLDAYH